MRSFGRPREAGFLKARRLLASDAGIITIIILVILYIYLADLGTPLGEPVWLLYFIPLGLSYWSGRYYAIPAVSIAIMLFLIAGFFPLPARNYHLLCGCVPARFLHHLCLHSNYPVVNPQAKDP